MNAWEFGLKTCCNKKAYATTGLKRKGDLSPLLRFNSHGFWHNPNIQYQMRLQRIPYPYIPHRSLRNIFPRHHVTKTHHLQLQKKSNNAARNQPSPLKLRSFPIYNTYEVAVRTRWSVDLLNSREWSDAKREGTSEVSRVSGHVKYRSNL